MAPREADDRYLDIPAAIGRIRAHVEATRGIGDDEPAAADLLRDAVHYQLIVIGEAIGSLPASDSAEIRRFHGGRSSVCTTGSPTSTTGSSRR